MLSHYTRRAGLEGIARSKTLWATDFAELNDKVELEFGHVELFMRALAAAWDEVLNALRPDERRDLNLEDARKQITNHFRQSFQGPHGSERLYVCSFAKSTNEHEERLGILSLWHRYTDNKGYCLQFEEADVQALLRREGQRRNYAILDLANVQYGIDEAAHEYRELHFQLKHSLLAVVQAAKGGLSIAPKYDQLWPADTIATRFLYYCATHKHPFFIEERETRILAVAGKTAVSRFLVGFASPKQVKYMADGRSYIELGEDWTAKIEPRRIIIGPEARRDLDDVLALFDRKPEVVYADFPIRI